MTEPPRPPGEGNPHDPTRPFNPYAANDPASGSTPPPPYQPPPPYDPPPSSGPGYGAPPPPYGYQQPGYGAAPSQDDRTWIMIAHFGGALGAFLGGGLCGWVAPLITMLAKGNVSPAVRAESVKALNFQIVWAIVGLIGWVTACAVIGFFIIPVAALIAIVFGVIAGLKAVNNEPYNYPMTINLIK